MNFIDADIAPLANVKETPEGYLAAEAFSVRTGIQRYLGIEVGKPDQPFVDIYRPEQEVFSRESVATFAHKPLTIDHPPGGVDASTWRDSAVGEVSTEAMRDGERLKLQLIVKDAAAVRQVKAGARRQLSAGYTCDIDWTAGQTADGQPYAGVQRNIRVNHLALVERGRAGNCAIGDAAPWGITTITDATGAAPQSTEGRMTTKTIVMGDKAVNVLAEDAPKVEDYIAAANKALADAQTAAATKDGEIAALRQKLADAEMTPQKLSDAVAARTAVAAGYKALTGKDAPATMSDADMRRAAVAAKLGDKAAPLTDEGIAGAFAAFTADAATVDPLRVAVAGGIQYQDAGVVNLADVFKAAGLQMKKEA